MNPQIDQLQAALSAKRAQLLAHPMYAEIHSLTDFQLFMEQHIFAVWDFMSLLKALQRHLTCVEVPWAPKGSPVTRRFINEIVLGEESDLDSEGKVLSHFEMYLEAMQQIGANTLPIHQLTEWLSYGKSLDEALYQLDIREETRLYYLERHIEVDGGDHGPISLKMMEEICGSDANKWQEATEVSILALEKRYAFWAGVQANLNSKWSPLYRL